MVDPLTILTTIRSLEAEAIRMPAVQLQREFRLRKVCVWLLTSRTERKVVVLHVQGGLWERCGCLKD